MNVEKNLEKCHFNLLQIKHYNPDPYYVNFFLKEFIQSILDVYEEIIQEANRDFGLFIDGRCSLQNFEKKAKEKKDQLAIEFVYWFQKNYQIEHKRPYPNFINDVISFYKKNNQIPKIVIKIIANQRYKDDLSQEIVVNLRKGKIRSKEELELEIKRQIPMFLEIINQKRKNMSEPKVSSNQVIASTFLETTDSKDFEILDVCEAYFPVLTRFVKDSRIKIKELTKI